MGPGVAVDQTSLACGVTGRIDERLMQGRLTSLRAATHGGTQIRDGHHRRPQAEELASP